MSNEEQNLIPECFRQFEKFTGAIFKDGKILFPHYSTFLLVLQTILGFILISLIIYLLHKLGLLLNGFCFGFLVSLFLILDIIC